jgi:ubiquitin carboxyl-terminal hydrolase 14
LVTSALKVCFNELDPLNGGMRKLLISQQGNDDADQDLAEEEGYSPKPLLAALHRRLPHFAAKTSTGVFMQQDANECWTEVMRILQEQLRSYNIQGSDLNDHHRDTVTKYFRGHLESRFSCDECKEEPETKTVESFLQLSCFINAEVKYLLLGLRSRFKPETITKRSATLGRNAVYTRKSAITRLPAYLTVQLVRFHYKEKEKINAKILRDVAFPLRLDVYEFCSDELKKKLDPPRAKLTELINASVFTPTKTNKGKGSDDGEDGGRRSKRNRVMKRSSFADDPGASDTGIYDLQAVLTHQGRSSQSGHYVGWVSPRDAPGRPGRYAKTDWFKMNDDVVTPVEEAEILKLSGGGDWHCAYVLLYGPPVE